jgi:glycosyltransferase involved in cell wall biosynthesis
MKILLSAYACEPNKGSEPGVGWNWARALVHRGDVVHVITRSNNRPSIEAALASEKLPLAIIYYDLPAWARRWKRWPGGIYLYYLLWQVGAYRLAKRLHSTEAFDRVQHSTFASFRQPSFMGGLGIPFVFGPVGGGEPMPRGFRRGIPFAARVIETFRDLGSALTSYDPMMLYTFSRATVIACTTSDTLAKIPRRFQSKCIVLPAIGINESEIGAASGHSIQEPQFLFIGRLLYWKGVHLALRALAQVRISVPKASMKIIGEGGDRSWLKAIAEQAGVKDSIEWLSAVPHEEILQEYRDNVAFVFPSLHDSGGMVVLEALAAGLPVICLNLGGPGAIVTPSCGIRVEARHNDEASVVRSLANAMTLLATDAELRARLSANTVARARELTWLRAAQTLHSSVLLGTEHH